MLPPHGKTQQLTKPKFREKRIVLFDLITRQKRNISKYPV
jgi:hypothetical protein